MSWTNSFLARVLRRSTLCKCNVCDLSCSLQDMLSSFLAHWPSLHHWSSLRHSKHCTSFFVGFGRPRSSFFTLPFLSTSTYYFLPVYCNRVALLFFLERMCLKVSIDKLPRYCTAPGEPPQQVPLLLHESQAIPLDPAAWHDFTLLHLEESWRIMIRVDSE